MTATPEKTLMPIVRQLADGGIDLHRRGWLVDLCARTHGDWHFYGIQKLDAFGENDILIWTNGTRRAYVQLDSATKEMGRHDNSHSWRLAALWDRLTYMMDRVDAHTTEAA